MRREKFKEEGEEKMKQEVRKVQETENVLKGESLVWCRNCSGYAWRRLGSKRMNRCRREKTQKH